MPSPARPGAAFLRTRRARGATILTPGPRAARFRAAVPTASARDRGRHRRSRSWRSGDGARGPEGPRPRACGPRAGRSGPPPRDTRRTGWPHAATVASARPDRNPPRNRPEGGRHQRLLKDVCARSGVWSRSESCGVVWRWMIVTPFGGAQFHGNVIASRCSTVTTCRGPGGGTGGQAPPAVTSGASPGTPTLPCATRGRRRCPCD